MFSTKKTHAMHGKDLQGKSFIVELSSIWYLFVAYFRMLSVTQAIMK
jgi:hypothetical protein